MKICWKSFTNMLRKLVPPRKLKIMDPTPCDAIVYYDDGSREVITGVSSVSTKNIHREDGPALSWSNGTKTWLQHGMHHRMDGPAVITSTGEQRWAIWGKPVTKEVNEWLADTGIDPNKPFDYDDLDAQTAVCFLAFMISLEGTLTVL